MDAVDWSDPKQTLHQYLRVARRSLTGKLDGLSEYDVRRPLTPTGTNLLGVLKHVASVDVGYLGEVFGRPFTEPLPWLAEGAEDNADMWATADESRADLLAFAERAWAHSDSTVEELDLDATGRVPWWSPGRAEVNLHLVLVHVLAETNRHAGHCDIVRELIDGSAGMRAPGDNLPAGDEAWWTHHRDRVEHAARAAAAAAGQPVE